MSSNTILPEFEPQAHSGPQTSSIPEEAPETGQGSSNTEGTAGPLTPPSWFESLPTDKKGDIRSKVQELKGNEPDEATVKEMCNDYSITTDQATEIADFLKDKFVPLDAKIAMSRSNVSIGSVEEEDSERGHRPSSMKGSRQFSERKTGDSEIIKSYESMEQREIRKAQEKLTRLQGTNLHPWFLTFYQGDKVVLEMEDAYYREDASRFRGFLKILFVYGIVAALVGLTAIDLWQLQVRREGDDDEDDDESLVPPEPTFV